MTKTLFKTRYRIVRITGKYSAQRKSVPWLPWVEVGWSSYQDIAMQSIKDDIELRKKKPKPEVIVIAEFDAEGNEVGSNG